MDELTAGRELDALIAEKVMRLLDVYEQHGEWMFDGGIRMPVPAYSTDIAAAWKVVERMYKQSDDVYGNWARALSDTDHFTLLLEKTAPEAAYLICLAALKALS